MREEAAAMGIPVLGYDGYAEFWVASIQDWKDMIAAEGGLQTLVGEYWICPSCCEWRLLIPGTKRMRPNLFSTRSISCMGTKN